MGWQVLRQTMEADDDRLSDDDDLSDEDEDAETCSDDDDDDRMKVRSRMMSGVGLFGSCCCC